MKREVILRIAFWFFFIFGCILLVWYVFGDSPLIEQMALPFLSAFLILLYRDLSRTKERVFNELTDIKVKLTKLEEKK